MLIDNFPPISDDPTLNLDEIMSYIGVLRDSVYSYASETILMPVPELIIAEKITDGARLTNTFDGTYWLAYDVGDFVLSYCDSNSDKLIIVKKNQIVVENLSLAYGDILSFVESVAVVDPSGSITSNIWANIDKIIDVPVRWTFVDDSGLTKSWDVFAENRKQVCNIKVTWLRNRLEISARYSMTPKGPKCKDNVVVTKHDGTVTHDDLSKINFVKMCGYARVAELSNDNFHVSARMYFPTR